MHIQYYTLVLMNTVLEGVCIYSRLIEFTTFQFRNIVFYNEISSPHWLRWQHVCLWFSCSGVRSPAGWYTQLHKWLP